MQGRSRQTSTERDYQNKIILDFAVEGGESGRGIPTEVL